MKQKLNDLSFESEVGGSINRMEKIDIRSMIVFVFFYEMTMMLTIDPLKEK